MVPATVRQARPSSSVHWPTQKPSKIRVHTVISSRHSWPHVQREKPTEDWQQLTKEISIIYIRDTFETAKNAAKARLESSMSG